MLSLTTSAYSIQLYISFEQVIVSVEISCSGLNAAFPLQSFQQMDGN